MASIKSTVVNAATKASVPQGQYARSFPAVVVDLPCAFCAIRPSSLPPTLTIFRNMKFCGAVQHLANLVMERAWLDAGGHAQGLPRAPLFNGLDLHLGPQESDALGMVTAATSASVRSLLNAYLQVGSQVDHMCLCLSLHCGCNDCVILEMSSLQADVHGLTGSCAALTVLVDVPILPWDDCRSVASVLLAHLQILWNVQTVAIHILV